MPRRAVVDTEVGLRVTTSPEGGHHYWCNGVGPLPGATSITALQEAIGGSDALMNWAVSTSLRAYAASLAESNDETVARSDAFRAKNAARDLGSAVHRAVEAVNLCYPLETTTETAPYVAQYAAFLVKHRVEVIAAEQMVANLTIGYGGSFDLLANLEGRLHLIDVKTGKSREAHRLQLAGYEMAEVTGRAGEEVVPMPKVDGAAVLLLRADSFELVPYDITDDDREHFAALVATYHRAQSWRGARMKERAA